MVSESDCIMQKAQRFLEKQAQTDIKMAQTQMPKNIGEWVIQRLESGQPVTPAALQEWADEQTRSNNLLIQRQGQVLAEWLASLSKIE